MKDFYQDFGHNFIKLFKDKEVPSFVKEAEMLEPETLDSLPASAFACVETKSLPINDAANTYVSAAYYYGANSKNASVEERILKAAELFEILDNVKNLSELANHEKQAEEEKGWEISINTENGTKSFSGKSPTSIKKFAEFYVNELFNKLNFNEKVECAQKIAEVFSQNNLEAPERILQVSGQYLPNVEKLAEQVRARAVRVFEDDKKAQLCQMANDLLHSEEKNLKGMHKIAEILDTIDRQNYLTRFYGKSILDPFESVFNTPKEEAAKLATVVSIGEKDYSFEELQDISVDVLKLALSPDSCERIGLFNDTYNPSKLAELDSDERDLLASYL
jgi:predicted RNA-binding protein Jag